ncbi:MAG: hypothetical protein DMG32_21680 [Acidobacteria bacterium]|nr:MAG: hypothetical protein DMG32_21680 [Acidobacteriota bacterium]
MKRTSKWQGEGCRRSTPAGAYFARSGKAKPREPINISELLVSQRFDKTAIKSKESKVQRPARGAFTLYLLDLARKTPPGTKLDFRGEIKGNQTG